MLTNDLLRVSVRKGRVRPRYLDASDAEASGRAERLAALFAEAAEARWARQELDDAIEAIVGHGTDFLIWRGLAKLLLDRTTFATASAVDPIELRAALFDASMRPGAALGDDAWRAECTAEVAAALSITEAELEAGIYADLEARQRIESHKPLGGRALIDRYNLALAQAVLYRATALEIELGHQDPNRVRYLLSSLKFFGLMHRAWRTEAGVLLRIDGPASLFRKSKKYGLQMATFLPALVLMDDWGLKAELDWKGARSERHFELGPDDGLVSRTTARAASGSPTRRRCSRSASPRTRARGACRAAARSSSSATARCWSPTTRSSTRTGARCSSRWSVFGGAITSCAASSGSPRSAPTLH